MKKRVLALLMLAALVMCLTIPASAFVDYDHVYFADDSLDSQRLQELGETALPGLMDTLKFDLRVDIVDNLEGMTIKDYAQTFYDQYGYGYGDNSDGMLLMIQMHEDAGGVTFDDYCLCGGGYGPELLGTPDTDTLMQTLDQTFPDGAVDAETASSACADAIEIFIGSMTQQTMAYAGTDFATAASPTEAAAPTAAPAAEPTPAAASAQPTAAAAPAAASATAAAASQKPAAASAEPEQAGSLILDNAGLLEQKEWLRLESKAESLSKQYSCGIYVLTVDTMNGMERRDFAKKYYKDNDLGYGDGKNGILFLVAMDTRDYVTITYGKDPSDSSKYGVGITAFTDYGIEKLEDGVVEHLSDGDYYKAFDAYVTTCGKDLKYLADHGEPYDSGNSAGGIAGKVAIVVIVPLLIALLVCLIFRRQMKTAVKASEALAYIPQDGFQLSHQADRFLFTSETRRKIEKKSSSGGSSVDSDGFGGSSGGKF